MDLATITAAYEGLKASKQILGAIFEAKVDAEAKPKVIAALEQLGNAQDALFSLREELFRLQSVNDDLRKQLAALESWDARGTNGGTNGVRHHNLCSIICAIRPAVTSRPEPPWPAFPATSSLASRSTSSSGATTGMSSLPPMRTISSFAMPWWKRQASTVWKSTRMSG
jgi:hypothetical protein